MAGRSGSLGRSSRHGLGSQLPAQCCFGVTADFVGRVSISFSMAKHEGMLSRDSRRRDLGQFLPVNCPPVRYIETYTQLKPEQCHETCRTRSPNQTLSLIRSEVISRDIVDSSVATRWTNRYLGFYLLGAGLVVFRPGVVGPRSPGLHGCAHLGLRAAVHRVYSMNRRGACTQRLCFVRSMAGFCSAPWRSCCCDHAGLAAGSCWGLSREGCVQSRPFGMLPLRQSPKAPPLTRITMPSPMRTMGKRMCSQRSSTSAIGGRVATNFARATSTATSARKITQ